MSTDIEKQKLVDQGFTFNLWEPDTCGCIVEFYYDPKIDANQRVHTPFRVLKECELHSHDNDPNTCLTILTEESQRKNHALRDLAEIADANTVDTIGEHKMFKEQKEPKYHFDKDRNLVIDTSKGFTGKSKKSLEGVLTKYENKVKVI